MKFYWLINFFLVQKIIIMHADKLYKLIKNLNPYGCVIFTDNFQELNAEHYIFLGNLINLNPTVIIDLNEFNKSNDNRSFAMSIFQNPRKSAVYIIFLSKECKTTRILDIIIKISPVSSRPRTLLFLPKYCSPHEEKKILTKAWTLKFIDFSIVKIDTNNMFTFKTYDPFIDEYSDINCSNDVDNIFPNKLNNVHAYPLITRAYNVPPIITTVIKENKIIKVGGTRFARIKYIAEKLNFKLQFKEDLHNVTLTFEKIIENLESNEINASPVGFLLSRQFQNKNFIYGNPMNIGKIVVIVPVIKTTKIDISSETFVLLLIFSTILIIFYIFVRIWRFDTNYWNIINIFGILIGVSTVQPINKVSRIIFMTIAILSMIFSYDYFSTLANIKQLLVEEDLNTYKDIERFKLPIYIPNFYADNDTEYEKNLNFRRIDSIHGCIQLLIETNEAVCIAPTAEAEHFSKVNLNSRSQPVMKITDLSFRHQFDSYLYEKASPFAEKIEKSLLQIIESGMISVQDSWARNEIRFVHSKQSLLLEEVLLNQIILITMITGCTFSIIIFLFESLHSH